MKKALRTFIAGTLLTCWTGLMAVQPVTGQSLPVGDPYETYLRMLQSDLDPEGIPSFNIRPVGISRWQEQRAVPTAHPWQDQRFFNRERPPERQRFERFRHWDRWNLDINLTTPHGGHAWNSEVPFGQNDGALWQGRGQNWYWSMGLHAEWGPLEATFRPEFGYSHNSEFELSPFRQWPFPMSPLGEPLARIDMPQRFGHKPLTWLHPGQSTIQLRQWGVAAGVSTANIWSGPAIQNPLVLSNNAPGFFHAFLGTHRPVSTPLGHVEGKLFWGSLYESDYFDSNRGNNRRYITGLIFNYSPSFAPGLHLGFQRVFHEYLEDGEFTFSKFTRVIRTYKADRYSRQWDGRDFTVNNPPPFVADYTDRFLTFFGRWAVPDTGFEAWVEWGRNDQTHERRSFLNERVNTRAYVLGLRQRFHVPGNRWLSLSFEMTQLESVDGSGSFNYPTWYEHPVIRQGFTNRGQVIGAGIGPGSNSQMLRLDLYDRWGMGGISFNRVVNNNDRLYRHIAHIIMRQRMSRAGLAHEDRRLRKLHALELRYGVHGLVFLPYGFELQGDLYRTSMLNRYNLFENDLYNTNVKVTLRYNMRGMVR